MHPILFEFGPVTVYSYGVLLAASYLLGLQFALMRARARGLNGERVMDLGIWIIISALVGAKLLLVVVDYRQFTTGWSDLLNLARSGGVFYGGLIGAVTVAFWYMWRHKMPLWTTTDVFAPAIALGHAVGRLGCLLAGCCFGRETSVPWAVTFHNQLSIAPRGVPLHPTQLYEAGAELIILAFLLATERRGHVFAGRTFWSYMFLYGVSRFVIEFYRGDDRGMVFNMLSTSQVVSLLLVPLSVIMLLVLSRRANPGPVEAARSVRAA